MSWEAAEEEVLDLVKIYFPGARRTRGSGNVHGDGDVRGIPGIHLDVKDQSTASGFTINKEELDKVEQQALSHHPPRKWVIATRNKDGKLVASCDLDVLLLALSYLPEGVI